ncbi:MAG: hypothetical protein AAGN15_03035 [Cyanobacteria bacterium J06581_3]
MPPTKILQIVPRLPPYSDGVGDYARLLAQQLRRTHQIETEFITFRPGTETPDRVDGFRTHRLFTHSVDAFISLSPKNIGGILLHYSNYPYLEGKLNAPFWLVQALRKLRQQKLRQHKSMPLVTMFHELPTLKWKQIRILNPIQSQVSRQLSRLASAVFTDSHHFKKHLQKWTQAPITCIPDFSTIGEPKPTELKPLKQRQRRLVVFGSSDRIRAYQNRDRLLATCKALNIPEIYDIGAPQKLDPRSFSPLTFTEIGFQPAERVQTILLDSIAGLIDYSKFPGDLGKSSVFAAFCAHGLMPICTAYNPSEPDGIFADKQYAIAGKTLTSYSPAQCQTIADQARTWYCQHDLASNARQFASHFV